VLGFPGLKRGTMSTPAPILVRKREVVVGKRCEAGSVECTFASGGSLRISNSLGAHVKPGDEIQFSLPGGDSPLAPELLIRRTASDCLYQTPIGYVSGPKTSRLQQAFASAAVSNGRLGLTCLHLLRRHQKLLLFRESRPRPGQSSFPLRSPQSWSPCFS